MTDKRWDLLCMGRAAVDLYGDQIGAELEDASSFSKYVGGCPANVAIGCARLGLRTAMLTRVGDEAMGRFVERTLDREGVDTSLVKTDPKRLTGLVLLGVAPPEHFPLIFYRENCADMAISPEDFTQGDIADTRALLVTGTHLSQREPALSSYMACQTAEEVGTPIILDIDYRPVLWGLTGHGDGESRYVSSQVVSERMEPILVHCSLIVGTEEEFRIATGEDSLNKAIDSLRSQTQAALVLKRGAEGCAIFESGKDVIELPGFPVDIQNVLGAGDAFLSGFLRGWLADKPLDVCGTWGNACGAIVVSRHGCSPAMPYWEELRGFVTRKRLTKELDYEHRCRGRWPPMLNPLCVLAFDHLEAFEVMPGASSEGITRCKELISDAIQDEAVGVILDDTYSSGLLNHPSASKLWVARALRKDPLCLQTWPKQQTVKVLHSEVTPEALEELQRTSRACEQWGLELLIELTGDNRLEEMAACYAAGVRPAWWKLPLQTDWKQVSELIESQDPFCRGVLVLGQAEPIETLIQAFESLAPEPIVKGFAVGRSIWQAAAEEWFAGKISDEDLVAKVSERLNRLIAIFNTHLTTTG